MVDQVVGNCDGNTPGTDIFRQTSYDEDGNETERVHYRRGRDGEKIPIEDPGLTARQGRRPQKAPMGEP